LQHASKLHNSSCRLRKHTSTTYKEGNFLLSETKFQLMHADDFPKHILQDFLAKIHEGGEERTHWQAELPHTSQQQRLREFFNRSHHRKSSVTNNQ
jgi:hypothetical protein